MKTPTLNSRLAIIDGLRGLAAVGVVLFHTRLNRLFWMWSFVDLFFVISGFLITSILIYQCQGRFQALKNFYIRRALRIWPLYYLTLLYCLGYALATQAGAGLVWPYASFRSFFFLQFIDFYWADLADVGIRWSQYIPMFGPSWSLAVEEQFYLLWPFVVFALRRRPAVLAGICSTWVLASVVLGMLKLPYILMMTRADGLALGALLALVIRADGVPALSVSANLLRRSLLAALVIGALIVAYYMGLGYLQPQADRYQHMVNEFTLAPVIFGYSLFFASFLGLMLMHGLSGGHSKLLRSLASRPLVYLGSVSYALYLFHQPVFSTIYTRAVLPAPVRELLSWVLLFALAECSRRWLEARFHRAKHNYPIEAARSKA